MCTSSAWEVHVPRTSQSIPRLYELGTAYQRQSALPSSCVLHLHERCACLVQIRVLKEVWIAYFMCTSSALEVRMPRASQSIKGSVDCPIHVHFICTRSERALCNSDPAASSYRITAIWSKKQCTGSEKPLPKVIKEMEPLWFQELQNCFTVAIKEMEPLWFQEPQNYFTVVSKEMEPLWFWEPQNYFTVGLTRGQLEGSIWSNGSIGSIGWKGLL